MSTPYSNTNLLEFVICFHRMGNAESQQPRGPQADAESSEMRTCYYEVLEVERSESTTTDDIKKVSLNLPIR
jgi:hypothetical protein